MTSARPAAARGAGSRRVPRRDRRSVHALGVVLCALVLLGAHGGPADHWPDAAAGPLAALSVLWCRWAGAVGGRRAALLAGARAALAVAVPAALLGVGAAALPLGVAVAVCGLVTAEVHRVVGRAVDRRRARGARSTRSRHPLATPLDLAVLVVAAVAGAVGSLVPGAAVLAGGAAPDLLDAVGWVLRTASCVLVVVGAALVLTTPGGRATSRRALVRRAVGDAPGRARGGAVPTTGHPAEVAVLLLAATAVHVLVWSVLDGAPLAFVALPLSAWVALRGSTATTALHVLVVGAVVTQGAAGGTGPVAGLGELAPLVAHAFAAVLAVVCLALALYRHQRDDLLGHLARTRRAADERADLLRLAFADAPTGMAVVGLEGDRPGAVQEGNAALAALVGQPAPTLPGSRLDDLVGPHDGAGPCALDAAADHRGATRPRCEHALGGPGGRRGRVGASRVHPRGREPYLLVVVEDVTAERRLERALRHRAAHDPLTDLPRRELLLARADAAAGGAGLLFLDLDGFKAVNDSAGHAAGDELLRHVARRLVGTAGPDAMVARLGGDEFAVLALAGAGDSPGALRELGHRLVAALEEPVILDSGVFTISASVGGRTASPRTPAARLLHDADLAMYAAKRAGRGRVLLHEDVVAR